MTGIYRNITEYDGIPNGTLIIRSDGYYKWIFDNGGIQDWDKWEARFDKELKHYIKSFKIYSEQL